MKKIIIPVAFLLAACSAKKETPEQVAEKWCKMHKEVMEATDEKTKEKAEEAKKEYEREVEEKYKNDDAFMKTLDEKIEECEEEEGVDYDGD